MAAGEAKGQNRAGELIATCPDSHAEIAAKVGVDKSLVTRWRSGARRPTDVQLARLEELYGAPVAARRERPKAKSRPRPKASTSPAVPPPPSRPSSDEDEHADEDNAARLRRYIREGMRELELDTELSGVKRAEALKKLVDAQVALDKSTGENALTMQRIAVHPEFVRVVRLITEAIAPYPDALAAATRVLEASR